MDNEAMEPLLAAFLALNAVTFLLYWHDKRCARNGGWRVPEAVLLALALAGGSPAAYAAMRFLRHKTRKTGFRARYWLIVAAQLAVLAYLCFTDNGLMQLRRVMG